MKRLAGLALIVLLAACHHRPAERPILTTDTLRTDAQPMPSEGTAPPDTVDLPAQSLTDAPPCLPVDPNTKISPRPRRIVTRTAPPPAVVPAPALPAPVGEAAIKPVENLSMSVLGKKVHGARGEDLGRVVDVIADVSGQVRIAIIEFGGFLGVGLKRVAVDWSLLKFQKNSEDSPWLLDVPQQKLQAAPEYKDGHPYALMAPPSAAVAAPVGASPAPDTQK